MGKLERITVTLTKPMAESLRAAVEEGAFATTSEVVRQALREWSDAKERRAAELERLRDMIAEGEKGPFRDANEVFDEIEAELQAMIDQSEQTGA